jgi:hypothetical protein
LKNYAALKFADGIFGSRDVEASIPFGWISFGDVYPSLYPLPNNSFSLDIEGSF